MSKGFIIILGIQALIVTGIISLYSMSAKASEERKALREKYDAYLGKQFVLDGDTTTIIDHSILTRTFTLSNGTEVNYALVAPKEAAQ